MLFRSRLADRLGYECRLVGDATIHVSTPFIFADGEPISFYIEDHGRDITVFDNADTLMHLSGIGLDISDRKRWKGIRQIFSSFGLPQPGSQSIQWTSGSLCGMGDGTDFGCPTMIGATDTQATGIPSAFFPSVVFRKL